MFLSQSRRTPTAAPAGGTLRGWQVTTSNIGLVPFGLDGPNLPVWTPPSGEIVPNGTTITGMRINTILDIHLGDILIEKCYIRPSNIDPGFPVIYNLSGDSRPTNVIIRDCEITGEDATDQQVAYTAAFLGIAASFERNYIHHVGSGIALINAGLTDSTVIRHNHINQLRAFGTAGGDGSHNDGITVREFDCGTTPTRTALIEGNYVNMDSGNDTGAMFIQTADGNIDNVTMRYNFFGGNGYQTALEGRPGFLYGTHIDMIDNRMSNTDFGTGYVDPAGSGATWGYDDWTDNYIYDAGQPDARGASIVEPSWS